MCLEVGDMVDDTDEMRELERKARQMAQEAEKDQPRMKKDVLFVRYPLPSLIIFNTEKFFC